MSSKEIISAFEKAKARADKWEDREGHISHAAAHHSKREEEATDVLHGKLGPAYIAAVREASGAAREYTAGWYEIKESDDTRARIVAAINQTGHKVTDIVGGKDGRGIILSVFSRLRSSPEEVLTTRGFVQLKAETLGALLDRCDQAEQDLADIRKQHAAKEQAHSKKSPKQRGE